MDYFYSVVYKYLTSKLYFLSSSNVINYKYAIFNFSGNPQQEEQPQQSATASSSSINWDAIQHAVKTVVTTPSAPPSAPNSAAPLPSSSPSPSLEESGMVTKEIILGYTMSNCD